MSKLSEFCIKITDGEHGSVKDDENGSYFFLNNNNITDQGIIISQNDRRISKSDFDRIHKRTQLDYNDIIIATCGTIGKSLVIQDHNINYEFSRSVGIIKCDTNKLLPLYLHYFFENPVTQARIKRISEGGVQKHFYIGAMSDFDIEVPSLEEQKKIVQVLSSLDAKISLNRSIISDLESLSRQIYDYWFVQFDFPDEHGRPYKSSGGKMVWNNKLKRRIPATWEVKSLRDIENIIITGKTPSTKIEEYFGGNIPFVTIDDIRGNSYVVNTTKSLSKLGADTQFNKYLPPESLCVSCIATPGLVGFTTAVLSQTNQQINSIVFKNNDNKLYLYFALKDYFATNFGVKTGNTFANMNKDEFSSIQLAYSEKIIKQFSLEVSKIFEKIKCCLEENRTLTTLRDFLLPMLMNGQVTVK